MGLAWREGETCGALDIGALGNGALGRGGLATRLAPAGCGTGAVTARATPVGALILGAERVRPEKALLRRCDGV